MYNNTRAQKTQAMYSSDFATIYDLLMGDTSTITQVTKKLLAAYLPKGSSILELGCGTGNILQRLESSYTVSGIDNAPAMLIIAKKKVPTASLYHADIRNFRLPTTYDGLLCIFDTINHLTKRSDWNRLFRNVSHHLKKDGVFIFDMNTLRRLTALSGIPPYTVKIDQNTLACVKIRKAPYGTFNATFQIFQDIQKSSIRYIEQEVPEASFSQEVVEAMLLKYFTIEKRIDPTRKRISQKTGRIFYVCRKKSLV